MRKKCAKIQNSFEDRAEHLFYHSKSTFVTEVQTRFQKSWDTVQIVSKNRMQ